MHVATRDDETIAPSYSSPKHLNQKKDRVGSTASFLLTFALTVSMLLSLVPSLAWAEVVENYAEVGEIIAERLGYTVDVTYDDYTYSFPGEGSYKVSEVLSVLGINATIDDVNLELVSGTDKAGALYLTRPNGEWYLNSDVAFDSTYELTVVSGDVAYVITVTDAEVPLETDLIGFLTNFQIEGATKDETTGTYTVTKGEPYSFTMTFKEDSRRQFNTSQPLTFQLPTGIRAAETITNQSMIVTVEHDGKTGEASATYSIDKNGLITVKFDQNDPDYELLSNATNVTFDLKYDAVFNGDSNSNDDITLLERTIKTETPTPGDAWIRKSGELDRSTGKMKYTIVVGASSGNVETATVSDIIGGNALTFDQNSIKVTSSRGTNPNITTKEVTETGFTYKFSNLADGEYLTITYEAALNITDSDNDGKLEASQTENTVTVKAGDNEAHEAKFSQEITYATTSKSAGTLGETTAGKRSLEWVVTYNADALASAAGHTITDTIDAGSQQYMKYDQQGITVYVKDKEGNVVKIINVANESLDDPSDKGWKYTIPDDPAGNYVYEIHYNTTVDMNAVDQTGSAVTLVNDANGTKATQRVEPGTSIEVAKSVANIDTTNNTITWDVTITVPAGGLSKAVVTDTLPGIWLPGHSGYNLDELVEATGGSEKGNLTITGLQEGETYGITYKSVNGTDDAVVITFYKDSTKQTQGLQASTNSEPRTITVTLTTKTNETWINYGKTNGAGYLEHTNRVDVNGVSASATAFLGESKIKKTGSAVSPVPETGATRIKYDLLLSGVSQSTIEVIDVFDTSKLEVSEAPWLDGHMYIFGGDYESWQGEGRTPVTWVDYSGTTEGGGTESGIKITADSVPTKADGSYYPYYRITYYLDVREGVNLMDEAINNGGTYGLKNTASWNNLSDTFTYNTVYDYLIKEQVGETANTSTSADGTTTTSTVNSTTVGAHTEGGKTTVDRMAEYRITLNPAKATLNGGDSMTLTDTMSKLLGIDPTSVQIVTDPPEAASEITYKTDFGADGSTIATYVIPDNTKVTITYNARVFGSGTVNFTNTANFQGRTETISSSANMGNDSGGSSSLVELTVLKSDGNHQGRGLGEVWFRFYSENRLPFNPSTDPESVTELYYMTDSSGQFVISQSNASTLPEYDGEVQNYGHAPLIYPGEKYYLEEVEPPAGYETMDHPYEFVFVDDPSLVDHAGVSGQYRYYIVDSANVENWSYSGLVIQKKVESADPTDLEREYEFKLTLLNENGAVQDFTGDKKPGPDATYGITHFDNGVATQTIKAGEQWRIYGLDLGQHYKVEEILPSGSAMTVSYGVTDGSEEEHVIATGHQEGYAWIDQLPANSNVAVVTATNTQLGALRLTKAVTVNGADPNGGTLADGTYTFTVTGPGTGTGTTTRNVTITIEKGVMASAQVGSNDASVTDGYVLISGLQPGEYTVAEVTGSGNSHAQVSGDASQTVNVEAGVAGEASPLVTITNNVNTGSLEISKQVISESQEDLINQTFPFTIVLSDGSISGTYGDVTFTNGKADDVSLKHGQTVRITGLPVGITYTVTETDVTGFTLTKRVVNGTELGASADATGAISTTTSTVEFTNTRQTGGFTVKKTVVGAVSSVPTDFTFTVTLSDTSIGGDEGKRYGGMTFTNGVAIFTLKNGESLTTSGLPVGIGYTVEETHVDGFTTTWTNDVQGGIVVAGNGSNVMVEAVNTRDTGNLQINKQVVSTVDGDKTRNYNFTLTFYTDSAMTQEATGIAGNIAFSGTESTREAQAFTGGSASFTLTNGETARIEGIPTGIYYKVDETDTIEHMTKTASGDTGVIVSSSTVDASIASFINTRNVGGLTIAKSVQSATAGDRTDATFHYEVTFYSTEGIGHRATTGFDSTNSSVKKADGAVLATISTESGTYGSVSFNLKNGEVAIIEKVPSGYWYEVTETSKEGYVTTVVDEKGDTNIGVVEQGVVRDNDSFVAAYTNTRLGSLRLTKAVTVNGSSTNVGNLANGTYSFEVSGPSSATTPTAWNIDITISNGSMTTAKINSGEAIDVSSNQYVELAGLVPGSYSVKETSSDNTSMQLDETVYNVEVAAGANGNKAAALTITNNRAVGGLTVRKEELVNAVTDTDTRTAFTFDIVLTDNTISGTYNNVVFSGGKATVSLKAGEAVLITGLPVGVGYTVTERATENFSVVGAATQSGTISRTTSTATFTNKRDLGDLLVSKHVEPAGTTSSFHFTVTLNNNTVTGTFGDMEFVNGVASIDLADGESAKATGLPAGVRYTVKEDAYAGSTLYQTGSGSSLDSSSEPATGLISKGDTATVSVTNRAPGSLLLSKQVAIGGQLVDGKDVVGTQADGTYTFTLKGPGTVSPNETAVTITIQGGAIVSGTIGGSPANKVTYNGVRYIEIPNLEPGNYTITEETTGNGTTLSGIKVADANVDTDDFNASTAHVVVAAGKTGTSVAGNATAQFVNNRAVGALELTKLVSVNDTLVNAGDQSVAAAAANGTYTFKVAGPAETSNGTSSSAKIVTITIENGKVVSATIDGKKQTPTSDGYVELNNLLPGYYTITETSRVAGTTLTDITVSGSESTNDLKGVTDSDHSKWSATVYVQANETASAHMVSFTNNIQTGSLRLSKLVTISGHQVGIGETRADGTYRFTVAGPSEGSSSSHAVTIIIDKGRVVSGTVDGKSVTLVGGYIEVANLLPGTYTITEAAPTNGTMFTRVSGGVNPASATNGTTTATVVEGKTGTSVAAAGTVTFTNNIDFGSLTVKKSVNSSYGRDRTAEFEFEVELVGATDITGKYGDMTFNGGVATFTLKDGDEATATGLPIGTNYIVREKQVDGITTTTTQTSGTIYRTADGSPTTVEFTNTRGMGELVLNKEVLVDGQATSGTLADGVYTFEIVGPGEGTFVSTTRAELEIKNGQAATVTKTDLPTGHYVVREVAGTNQHVTMDAREFEVEITTGSYDSAAPVVTFTNKVNTGSLTVSKTVTSEDKGSAASEFGFTVTLSDTSITGTFGDMAFVNGVASFTLRDGESITAKGLPENVRYTVEETSLPSGYVEGSHQNATGTIVAGKETLASMQNAYAPDVPTTPRTPEAPAPRGGIPRTGDTMPVGVPPFLLAAGLALASVGYLLKRRKEIRPHGAHMRR